MTRRTLTSVLLTITGGLVGKRLVFGYIDPNTGGLLFQLLAVMFTFFTGFVLFFSRHIRQLIARTKRLLRDDQ